MYILIDHIIEDFPAPFGTENMDTYIKDMLVNYLDSEEQRVLLMTSGKAANLQSLAQQYMDGGMHYNDWSRIMTKGP